MLIIFGCYRFLAKIVAYRADWCNVCQKEVVAHQVRKLYVGHVFWIPLLPLGFFKNWHCSVCNFDPHTRVATSIGFYIGGIAGLLLLLALLVFGEIPPDTPFKPALIALCVGGVLAIGYGLNRRLREPPTTREVAPLTGSTCLICQSPLPSDSRPKCAKCGAERI